ncbi:MAG TPA: SDR family oxidoreductase [Gemmatimonadaceae bacterium]|nr:SDR family oxidoreductase [Gemmatimonadaceae bacterium]
MTKPVVLVTGAGGYLGGRLVQHLERGGSFAVRRGSRQPRAGEPGSVAIGELRDGRQLEEACRGAGAVVHLAALNEIDSARDPALATEINVEGTRRLVAAAARAGVGRFVYLSTAHVYGAPLAGRIDEDTPTHPAHPYATTHRVAEDVVFAARDRVEAVVLRLSNAIGAPTRPDVDRWTLVVNDLCRQAATTGKLTLRSSGLARRDFIAMSDACAAIEHFLLLERAALPDGPVNLGGGKSLRVIDIVELVADRAAVILGERPAIVRPEPAPGELHPDLDYRIDLLVSTGFALHGDLAAEIDDTLRLCAAAFGRKRVRDGAR